MKVVVDTSVLIDVLRGHEPAGEVLYRSRISGTLHASEVVRLEVLSGMRPRQESATRTLLEALIWHPVDEKIAEIAGELGRKWLTSHRGIDSADLAIAATATLLDAPLLTKNIKHFPMFKTLEAPY